MIQKLKEILKKKYKYKGNDVVVVKKKNKNNLVTIKILETGLILKVQKHLVEGLK